MDGDLLCIFAFIFGTCLERDDCKCFFYLNIRPVIQEKLEASFLIHFLCTYFTVMKVLDISDTAASGGFLFVFVSKLRLIRPLAVSPFLSCLFLTAGG